MVKILFLSCILSLNIVSSYGQTISPDSTASAMKQLKGLKQQLSKSLSVDKGKNKVARIQRMLELGMWEEAIQAIAENKKPSAGYKLLLADYLMLNNELKKAETIVNEVLKGEPKNEKALLLKVFLEIQAWRLPQAAAICERAVKEKSSEKLHLMLGRVRLLQKKQFR